MHSNCPHRPCAVANVNEKCFPFCDTWEKIEFSQYISVIVSSVEIPGMRNVCARAREKNTVIDDEKYMQNFATWKGRNKGCALPNTEHTHTHPLASSHGHTLTGTHSHTHTYKIHYTVRDSPMKIAHRSFILISFGRQGGSISSHRRCRHCHRILMQWRNGQNAEAGASIQPIRVLLSCRAPAIELNEWKIHIAHQRISAIEYRTVKIANAFLLPIASRGAAKTKENSDKSRRE